jgi:hypothetical protein
MTGGSPVLGGSAEGRRLLGALIEAVPTREANPTPAFLDFGGITVATASFLRESVLAFRDHVRRRHSHLYPVIANAGSAVTDDLSLLLRAERDAVICCALDDDGVVSAIAIIGDLDPKQQLTLDLVRAKGEADARELMLARASDPIQHTAWNNRLAGLASLGLLIETSHGRTKRYRPVLVESRHGC